MASIYKRGGQLWARVKDETGAWVSRKTPYKVGEEEKARRYVRKMADVLEARRNGEAPAGPITVAEYAKAWIKNRVDLGLRSASDDEARLKNHALPVIGALLMEEVRPRHIRDLVLALRAKDKLAPRTIRHVYGTLSTLFRTAVADEIIIATPCVLPRGVLPKNKDRDPDWRATAVFTREEIETLVADERILPDRRVLNALKGLAALRHGEAASLRWSRIDFSLEPLAAINLGKTKTQVPRRVPVHPVLAAILRDWKERGYAELYGKPPADDDLVLPTRNGTVREPAESQEAFLADLAMLGFRRRRGHDLRRSFISLALVDGARRDLLEVVTHGPRGDIISMYSTFPWPALCAEVEKLAIRYAPADRNFATSLATDPITCSIYSGNQATPTRRHANETRICASPYISWPCGHPQRSRMACRHPHEQVRSAGALGTFISLLLLDILTKWHPHEIVGG